MNTHATALERLARVVYDDALRRFDESSPDDDDDEPSAADLVVAYHKMLDAFAQRYYELVLQPADGPPLNSPDVRALLDLATGIGGDRFRQHVREQALELHSRAKWQRKSV